MSNTQQTQFTNQHPSTRGVHYLYLTDSKNRMVGCIATVRRGSDLFIGTSFCSGKHGDVFRKAQGRAIAEGRANRRAEEQAKIMEIFTSKSIDQTSDAVQFLTRAQHALRVNLELLSDCSVDHKRPNAFDVLKAILQSVIEFDNDLDDRMDGYYADATNEEAAKLCDSVLYYFQELELPGGLVRAARRKLNDVSSEAMKREDFDVAAALQSLSVQNTLLGKMFPETLRQAVDAIKLQQATGVLGPVVPPTPTSL